MSIINSVIKGKQPVIDTLNVTPTTSAQQITAPQGTDGYSPVNVSAVTSSIDANIVAGNIKKDVQILGVTGSYEGTTPTGTVNITSNGTHNVSSYEYAEVLVPTTAPAYYIEKTKDANGKAGNGSHLMDFSTFTDIGNYVFAYAYYQITNLTGTVDLSGLTNITGDFGCTSMFSGCTGLTGINLSSLTTVAGSNACQNMCSSCTGITNINLQNLKQVSAQTGCNGMFVGCTGLTSISLNSLKAVNGYGGCQTMFQNCSMIENAYLSSLINTSGQNACNQMFGNCTHLINADLGSLTWISGVNACQYMFQLCSSLASVNISKLKRITSLSSMTQMFRNCTSLTSLSFDSLALSTDNFNGALANMLQGVTGCTVHFPAEWQTTMSSWSNVTNGFGGTNTTVLFDLPNTTTLDLSYITEIDVPNLFNGFDKNGFFPNLSTVGFGNLTTISGTNGCYQMFFNNSVVASVDLSKLTTISGSSACLQMFSGSTGLININLSSLMTTSGYRACHSMFVGCTGLTTMTLSSLADVGQEAFNYTYQNCSSLTTLSFPALKTVYNNQVFQYMLDSVNGCTVHFPSNMSSYNFNCGGTNTTVLYDLPATNILTGADTKEYERNPKYDTSTALAWRINGTMPNTTTYYTSGLTDPTVGTTIYSDSACTIAETTVDSIS